MRTPRAFAPVNETVRSVARKHDVKIFKYANVGNHLHLLIQLRHVREWPAFIRELSGRVAQIAQGISGRQKGVRFWAQRPFTRIVRGWRKPFQVVRRYIELNILEAEGFISRKETKTLKDLDEIFAEDRLLRRLVIG